MMEKSVAYSAWAKANRNQYTKAIKSVGGVPHTWNMPFNEHNYQEKLKNWLKDRCFQVKTIGSWGE